MTTTDIATSFVPWEAHELAGWLADGKPELGWRGDPRLELRIGVLTMHRNGLDRTGRFRRAGERLAWRYEIWRHNEDGTEGEILHRTESQFNEIIPELVKLDPRTPGHVPTMDLLEAHNKIVDKSKSDTIKEAVGEHVEHLWKLVADRTNGRTTFRGLPGRNSDRQM
jgi:hypothetical protein